MNVQCTTHWQWNTVVTYTAMQNVQVKKQTSDIKIYKLKFNFNRNIIVYRQTYMLYYLCILLSIIDYINIWTITKKVISDKKYSNFNLINVNFTLVVFVIYNIKLYPLLLVLLSITYYHLKCLKLKHTQNLNNTIILTIYSVILYICI